MERVDGVGHSRAGTPLMPRDLLTFKIKLDQVALNRRQRLVFFLLGQINLLPFWCFPVFSLSLSLFKLYI